MNCRDLLHRYIGVRYWKNPVNGSQFVFNIMKNMNFSAISSTFFLTVYG